MNRPADPADDAPPLLIDGHRPRRLFPGSPLAIPDGWGIFMGCPGERIDAEVSPWGSCRCALSGDAASAGRRRRCEGRPGSQEPKECREDGLRENTGGDAGRAVRADQRQDHGQGDDLRGDLTELHVPDRDGKTADVVLGFDNLAAYLAGHPHFGATTGRVANRIAKGKFTLDGKEYKLAVNNGPNSLHGGLKGFDKVVWKAEDVSGPDGPAVKLTYLSPDGEEGYPG